MKLSAPDDLISCQQLSINGSPRVLFLYSELRPDVH
jgi:hypothetical protein